MLSFFRRKEPQLPQEKTFKERVEEFWRWFEEVAPRFTATINAGKNADLTDETSAAVDELGTGPAWCYGPGENKQGHSLTVSGEGVEHLQLLTQYWLSRAPKIPGWTFYAARQPGDISGHSLEILGERIDFNAIWVTPSPNIEEEKIDLTVWHPAWERVPEKDRWAIVFLALDEVLGEYGTQCWVGEITFGKESLAQSFPLAELGDYVTRTIAKNEWTLGVPGDTWTLFKITPSDEPFPRGDLTSLTTAAPKFFRTYMEERDAMPDLVAGSGAEFIYISIDRAFFPDGDEVNARCKIEEALDDALRSDKSGRLIGGGLGQERGYIDLLIYDGRRSIAVVRTVLENLKVTKGTMIEFFAREKYGRRIAL